MSSDPLQLPVCLSTGGGVAGGGGFLICSGTPGNNYGSTTKPGPVPNDEDTDTRTYQNFFNNTTGTFINPCISTFTPAPGATADPKNIVGYINGNGCCTRYKDYQENVATINTVVPAINDRITRLTRFSTDTFDITGKRIPGGLLAESGGVPEGLIGMTKIWGVSPGSWLHGGVHADNVGAWNAGTGGFLIKYAGQTWSQQYVLWCRMTGDLYDPALDPYSSEYPAPNGSYITSKVTKGPHNPYQAALDGAGNPLRNPCQACSLDINDGQIYVNPGAKCPGLKTKDSTKTWGSGQESGCVSPYIQDCNMAALTNDVCEMSGPNGAAPVVPGMYAYINNTDTYYSYQNIKDGGFPGYTAEKRVGGCFTTEDMYGPGTFSVLVNLPPTLVDPSSFIAEPDYPVPDASGLHYGSGAAAAAGKSGGRGYVFSMWTFSYSEAYLPPIPTNKNGDKMTNLTGAFDAAANPSSLPGTRPGSAPTQYIDSNGKMNSGDVGVPIVPGITSGNDNDGYYTIHNHEIDIEIPSNTCQIAATGCKGPSTPANQKSYSGMNTANFNTWVTDQDSDTYAAGTPTLYQQAMATAPDGQFFASVGADDDENTYHQFSFTWFVDPSEENMPATPTPGTPSKSYVAFYRDGVEIFKCHRFVPRRSGRVVIGMWPAWWGSVRNPMAYSQVYCKIARLEFTPQCDITGNIFNAGSPTPGALVTNAPQIYDEVIPMADGSYSEIKCGFNTEIRERRAGVYAVPVSGPSTAEPPVPAPSKAKPLVPAPSKAKPPVPAPSKAKPPVPAPSKAKPPVPAPSQAKPPVPAPSQAKPPVPAPLVPKSSTKSKIPLWAIILICIAIAGVGVTIGVLFGVLSSGKLKTKGDLGKPTRRSVRISSQVVKPKPVI